jgi:hypothetical protein
MNTDVSPADTNHVRSPKEIRARLKSLRAEVKARDNNLHDELRRLWHEDVADAVAAGKIEVVDGHALVPAYWHGPKEKEFEENYYRTTPLLRAQINALEWVLGEVGKK